MTALKKYARLEATGLWRERPEEQRREVDAVEARTSGRRRRRRRRGERKFR